MRARDDTLCIFLFATREAKIQRLINEGIEMREAGESVDSLTRNELLIEKYFQMQWPNRDLYHAMLNTAA